MPAEEIFTEEGKAKWPNKEERVLAASSYIPFIGFATPSLVWATHTPFTLHHFIQGNTLFLAYLALNILYWIIPGIGFKIWWFTSLAYFFLSAWGCYQWYLGNMLEYGFLKPLTAKTKAFLQSQKKPEDDESSH